MLRAGLSQIFPADGGIAGLPVPAAEPAALVAEKLHLVLPVLGQSGETVHPVVEPEIRHHVTKLRPGKLFFQIVEIRQDLGGGGHEVQAGIGPPQVVQEQVRMDDDAVPGAGAVFQQAAEGIAPGITQVLRPEQGIAEGEPGGDPIVPQQGQDPPGVRGAVFHTAAAPETIPGGAVDGADLAPVVEILPVLPVQGQKPGVKLVKFKQAGKMVICRGFGGRAHINTSLRGV